jgi:ABC-type sugar transport system ATPase subunit
MTEIKISNLNYSYDSGKQVFKNFSLNVFSNEFLVLVGPSGCGKSTLLRLISGLDRPQSGDIEFDGQSKTFESARKRNVAMVFQSYALYPHFNVRGNLELALKIAKLPKEEIRDRVESVARFLELSEMLHKKPGQLSGGQRQRVAMGRALVRRPAVCLFDEPLSNLDAELRSRLRAEIKRMHAAFPVTKIFVTHDQVEAMTLADRMVILKDGEIQQIGTPDEIYRNPSNLFVAQFIGSPAMNLIPAKLRVLGKTHCQNVVLGFRPESFHLLSEESHSVNDDQSESIHTKEINASLHKLEVAEDTSPETRIVFEAKVTGIENLGSMRYVSLDSIFGNLCLSFSTRLATPANNENLRFYVRFKDFIVFDSSSSHSIPKLAP